MPIIIRDRAPPGRDIVAHVGSKESRQTLEQALDRRPSRHRQRAGLEAPVAGQAAEQELRAHGTVYRTVHHTAAKLRRDAAEGIEDVSRFLDHRSPAVTTTYPRRVEGQEDHGRGKVAETMGLELLIGLFSLRSEWSPRFPPYRRLRTPARMRT